MTERTRVRWSRGWTAVLALAALAVADGGPIAQQRERFSLTGASVAIVNLAGRLHVSGGTGDAVTIDVQRGGRDAAELKMRQERRMGAETFTVLYPGSRVIYPPLGRGRTTRTYLNNPGGFLSLLGLRQVTVAGSGSGTEAWADLEVQVPRGQNLRIHHVAGDVVIRNVDGELFVDHATGSLLAHGSRGKLSLDTGSGEVEVRDMKGDLTVDTGSGDVRIANVVGDDLRLDTGSGRVTVEGAKVDRLVADTGSGGVDLSDIDAREIHLDTGSGSIDLDLSGDVESLVADTGSGGVTIRAPADLGARFEIETGSGSIEVDFPHDSFEVGRDHARGRIGDGEGTIHVDTGSGGVRLVRRTPGTGRLGFGMGMHLGLEMLG